MVGDRPLSSERGSEMKHVLNATLAVALTMVVAFAPSAAGAEPGSGGVGGTGGTWSPIFELAASPRVDGPPPAGATVSFVLDDGQPDGSVGIAEGSAAKQFLFFNQFSLLGVGNAQLEEIQVLFQSEPSVVVGAAIELVVWHDPDGDPSNGAVRLAQYDETIQAVDGATFSAYPLPEPLALPLGGELLIGVVPRFIVSGITPANTPAVIDTTTVLGRSWLAVWTGDPPAPVTLPPDQFLGLVDDVLPGTWLIRGFASPRATVEIPTLRGWGVLLLASLLAWLGWRRLGG
ncbi:MAG: hypothetical protein DWQ36_14915 [Acidobacteria bacterium]|nr:MAG: hypothetical protein DWQ30_00015 [Acidobacteriota bacterium]REK06183.1 MAG: hypothetical protein DWQ36_14915 [Acidobacteriota bacterium]